MILKIFFYFIIILLIFAVLPENILKSLKKVFNWDVFLKTLKTGWQNFNKFLKESIGFNFDDILVKLKKNFGIDLNYLWASIKSFFNKLFIKLANFFE